MGERLAEHWRQSPLPGVLTWWRQELESCLPVRVKHRLGIGKQVQTLRWPLLAGTSPVRSTTVKLLLEPEQVLECDVLLPRMPRQALRKVLAYEIDKYTPFTDEQVYFAVRRMADIPPDEMSARLIVVARSRLDAIVQEAQAMGCEIAGVDVLDSDGVAQGIDLLPVGGHGRKASRERAVRFAALIGTALLALACMNAWIERGERALEVRRTQLAELRTRALQVDAMRKQLQARADVERALHLRESQRLSSVELLDLLTRCVPEQTWLDELLVDTSGQLSLSGSSTRASELPALLSECAGLSKARLEGGIQPERETGREHFTLLAQLPAGEGQQP
jgi:general secretion pathway protein L